MILVLVLLLLSSLLAFAWGRLGFRLFLADSAVQHPALVQLGGLAFLAFATAGAHFFFPINLWMQLCFSGIALIGLWFIRTEFSVWVKWAIQPLSLVAWGIALFSILARPGTGDIADYHLQAMKWAELFPTIPGLGNFNRPLANNNWWFNLQALNAFKLGNQWSVYVQNGFLLVLAFSLLADGLFRNSPYKPIYLGALLFLTASAKTAFIGSVTPDFAVTVLLFILVFIFLENIPDRSFWLILLSCFAFSIKLNSAPLGLLVLAALVYDFQAKAKVSFAIKGIWLGFLMMLTWLMGNILVSGWLVYPLDSVDLFPFDWKVPKSVLQFERYSIIQWGKAPGMPIEETAKLSLLEWLPGWFAFHDKFNQLIILLTCLAILINPFNKHLYKDKNVLLVYGFSLVGLIFCISNGPHIRYAFGYMWIQIGLLLWFMPQKFTALLPQKLPLYLAALGLLVSLIRFIPGLVSSTLALIKPVDYPKVQVEESDMDGFKVKISKQNNSCWDQFPCTYYMVEGCKLRGNRPEEGFWTDNSIQNQQSPNH